MAQTRVYVVGRDDFKWMLKEGLEKDSTEAMTGFKLNQTMTGHPYAKISVTSDNFFEIPRWSSKFTKIGTQIPRFPKPNPQVLPKVS